jgi:hypothetical protein
VCYVPFIVFKVYELSVEVRVFEFLVAELVFFIDLLGSILGKIFAK